jgi:replicative DNA helicase
MGTMTPHSLKPYSGMVRLAEMIGSIWKRVKDRYLHVRIPNTSVATGLRKLDEKLDGGLRRNNFTILGAASGHGKTTLALQFCRYAARQDPDSAVVLISPEMRPDDIAEMSILADLGVSRQELARESYILTDDATMQKVFDNAPKNFFTLELPPLEAGGLKELEDQLALLASQVPISLIALDYAQYVVGEIDTGKRQRFALAGDIVKACNRIAEMTKAAMLLTSQINVTREKGKITSMSLRESALFEHSAAAIVYFVREFNDDGEEQNAYFRITKNRYGSLGKIDVETSAGCYSVREAGGGLF